MAKPFKYRGKWRAQVALPNGTRPAKDFESHADACRWLADQVSGVDAAYAPELGGPTVTILAKALDFYARHHSVLKRGVDQELNRINHYLSAANLPQLKAVENAQGGIDLDEQLPRAIPSAFQKHNDARRQDRAGTYALIAELATKRCSAISPADIRKLYTLMKREGLSESTIQKEIAMLKAVFNTAVKEWSWQGFENPCTTVKLGKSERRFVALNQKQRDALFRALAQCENPYFFPMVALSKETTLRPSSVHALTWDRISLENRQIDVGTKTKRLVFTMSLSVQALLENLPRHPSGKVFPLSEYARTGAWNRCRLKAGLPELQYRDLRHIGATDWVRWGLPAHGLMNVMGHSNIQMAQTYVDLDGGDMRTALDAASKNGDCWTAPVASTADAAEAVSRARAERMRAVTAARVAARGDTPAAPAASAAESDPVLEAFIRAGAAVPSVSAVPQVIAKADVIEPPAEENDMEQWLAMIAG